MKILVLNPNSTAQLNDLIKRSISCDRSMDADVINPVGGPAAIQTADDEVEAVHHSVALISELAARVDGYDALIIACYGDPGLAEIAAMVSIPVVGIAQTSMAVAAGLSDNFGLIVAKSSAIEIMSKLATSYGYDLTRDAIEASGVPVLDMMHDPDGSYPAILAAGIRLRNKGIDTVCLGCASMGQFAARLRVDSGLTVIDSVKVTESVVRAAHRGR